MEIKRTGTRVRANLLQSPCVALVAMVGLLALVGCSTATPPATNETVATNAVTNAAPVSDTGEATYGRAALRLQFKYVPERTVTGGVGFAVDAPGGPIVLTSAHIVATMSKGKKLESVTVIDGVTREPVCTTLGIVWAGTSFVGFDLSKDVTALAVEGLPDSVARLKLATTRPQIGARVRILGVPADGSTSQVAIDGVVTVATSLRHEVDIDPSVKGRGLAGSPIVLAETGEVIGVVQAVTAKQGRAFLMATPTEAFIRNIPTAKPTPQPITVWTGQ